MAKPKLTLQQQYDKEIKRIEKLIKNAESIGFEWVQPPTPPKPKRVTEASIQKLKKITPQNIYKTAVYNDPISKIQFTGEQGQTIIKYRQTIQNDTILKNKSIETPTPSQTKKITKTKRKQTPRPKEIKTKRKGKPADKGDIVEKRVGSVISQVAEMLRSYAPPAHWSDGMASLRMGAVNNLLQQLESVMRLKHGGKFLEEASNRFDQNSDRIDGLLMRLFYDSDQWYVDMALNELLQILLGGALSLEANEIITELSEQEQGFDTI